MGKPFCLILMPFREEFSSWYTDGIRKACAAASAYCERVDEQNFDGLVIDRIYNQITKADVVIAELAGGSVNVFYEVGYAHAIGKRTILLADSSEQIPFDLAQYPTVLHERKLETLLQALPQKVEWAISQPEAPLFDIANQIAVFQNGKRFSDGDFVAFSHEVQISDEILLSGKPFAATPSLNFDFQNVSRRTIKAKSIQVGLEIPTSMAPEGLGTRLAHVSEDRTILLAQESIDLLPLAWQRVQFPISKSDEIEGEGPLCELRIVSDSGVRSIQFRLTVSDAQ